MPSVSESKDETSSRVDSYVVEEVEESKDEDGSKSGLSDKNEPISPLLVAKKLSSPTPGVVRRSTQRLRAFKKQSTSFMLGPKIIEEEQESVSSANAEGQRDSILENSLETSSQMLELNDTNNSATDSITMSKMT